MAVLPKSDPNNMCYKNDISYEQAANESNNNDKKTKLKDKVFVERKSLIQEMYDVKHIQNINYIFCMFLLTFFVNQVAYGIVFESRISLYINAIIYNFSDAHVAILGWCILFLLTALVHPVFQLWAAARNQMLNIPILRISWDGMWIAILLAYYYKIFVLAGQYAIENQLTFTSSFCITIEAARLLMKTHAFVRTNVSKVLRDKQDFKMHSAFHYLEFLFMPTLVYRDSYPRTKSINWTNVLKYASELCACVLFICYLYNTNFETECEGFKSMPTYHLKDFVWLIFRNTLPCLGIAIIVFYFILHLWQNMFAELTRFADRQFYQDWWNSTSYDEFYRKWNIIVHDWLYNYVYKDAFEVLTRKSTLLPKLLVFLLSAAVHEYVLYYTARMFYPVLGAMFFSMAMFLTSFRCPKYWLFNVLFLYGNGLGVSILLTSYTTEYCLRQNPCTANSPKFPFDWMYSRTLFSECAL